MSPTIASHPASDAVEVAQSPALTLPDGRVLTIARPAPRIVAYAIDQALALAGVVLLAAAVGAPVLLRHHASPTQRAEHLLLGLPFVVALMVAVMALTDGRTPGKALLGLRVARVGGEPVGLRFALWREVAIKWLLFGWPVLLAAPWSYARTALIVLDVCCFAGLQRRALHDVLSRSRVVEAPGSRARERSRAPSASVGDRGLAAGAHRWGQRWDGALRASNASAWPLVATLNAYLLVAAVALVASTDRPIQAGTVIGYELAAFVTLLAVGTVNWLGAARRRGHSLGRATLALGPIAISAVVVCLPVLAHALRT